MYEAFYGLSEKPFNLTPDPRFLFLSRKHEEAIAHLVFGIKNRSGFVMVSGEIGTGKTTICRTLLNQLDGDTEVAFIFNPYLSPIELLGKINEDFGIETTAKTIKGLIDELNGFLLERTAEKKNCVLVIDEAQNLDPEVLEQIRLLSNLETEKEKLLQIILVGQPELAQKLQLTELRQLNQRITARYHLKDLNFDETLHYIAYRLRVAGAKKKVHFTRGAIRAVYKFSNGTPRVINAVCDRTLLVGYTRDAHELTAAHVRHAAREIKGEKIKVKSGPNFNRFVPTPSVLVGGLIAVVAVILVTSGPFDRHLVPPERAHPIEELAPEPAAGALGQRNQVSASVEEKEVPSSVAKKAARPAPIEAQAAPEPTRKVVEKTPKPDPASALSAIGASDLANDGLAAMLRAWNMAVLSDFPEDPEEVALREFAIANGFSTGTLTLSLDQLFVINMPSLVQLVVDGEPKWVALLKLEGSRAVLSAENGGTLAVSRSQLETWFNGMAIAMWIEPQPELQIINRETRGSVVRAFQDELRKLGLWAQESSGVYDASTSRTVARIQEAAGISVDGIVGEQTRMVLRSWSNTGGMPSLSPAGLPAVVRQRILARAEGARGVGDASPPYSETQESVSEQISSVGPPPTESRSAALRPATGDAFLAPAPGLARVEAHELSEPAAYVPVLQPSPPDHGESVTSPSAGLAPILPRERVGGGVNAP